MESYYHHPWLTLMMPFQLTSQLNPRSWAWVCFVFQHDIGSLFHPRQSCAMGLYWPNHRLRKACKSVTIDSWSGNLRSWLRECSLISHPRACKEKRESARTKDRWKNEFLWLSSWSRYRVVWSIPKTWMHICTVLNRGFLHRDRTERSLEAQR